MMKRCLTYQWYQIGTFVGMILIAVTALCAGEAYAQQRDGLRFVDVDGDALNDVFRDADGDGINDLTGAAYPHTFPFADADGNGINDVFRDVDGDGLNDLLSGGGRAGAASRYPAIDANRDGYNDVTGERYRVPLNVRSFIDENGDGVDDREAWAPVKSILGKLTGDGDPDNRVIPETIEGTVPDMLDGDVSMESYSTDNTMDTFIDRNKDGINDGRTLNENLGDSFNSEEP